MAFRSANSNFSSSSVAVLTCNAPAGLAQYDLVIGGMAIDSGNANITTPFSFQSSNLQMSHDGGTVRVGFAIEMGVPATIYNFTSSASNDCVVFVQAHSGIDVYAPRNAWSEATTGATSAASPINLNAAGIVTDATCDLVFAAAADWNATDGSTYTPPGTFTESVDVADGNLASATMAYKDAVAAGSTGTITGTSTLAAATAAHSALLFAFKNGAAPLPDWRVDYSGFPVSKLRYTAQQSRR